jgi:hypothetical protein
MTENFRHFTAGPDPAGRTWQVDFLWLQTAVSIRHSDSIDVKFLLACGDTRIEKVVSLRHPDLLDLSRTAGRPLTDAWCMTLAARHLTQMIETGADFEKALATVEAAELARYSAMDASPQ